MLPAIYSTAFVAAGIDLGVGSSLILTNSNAPLVQFAQMPAANVLKLPAKLAGSSKEQVQATTELAPDSDIGAFRTSCEFSHMSFDDPIVYPGQPGKSHLHTFFGNTGTNAYSTAASIASTGDSTCRGGTANRSAYWVPALIDTKDGTPIRPLNIGPYYKTGYTGVQAEDVQPLPEGLRMIAADPTATDNQSGVGQTGWKCDTVGGGNSGLWGSIPPNCLPGATLWMVIDFPQCWDGKNLDSPDHKSHMAYSSGNYVLYQPGLQIPSYRTFTPTAGCPATHPVALPQITYNVVYQVPDDNSVMSKWRLSSDNYSTSRPGGYSAHGDYFMGWKPDFAKAWAVNCDRAKKDCHSHLLGDGRMIY